MKKNQQDFHGTQENMCEAIRLGCTLYDGAQKVFEANNLVYTKEWSANLRQKIIDALALPDLGTRVSIPSGKRKQLLALAQEGIDIWLILGGYIKNIATAEEVVTLLKEAGHDNYEPATRNKWPKVKALLDAGAAFIAEKEEWLLNEGKTMPAAFPAKYTAAAAAFTEASAGFYDAKGEMPIETSARVEAMNDVYHTGKGMLDDGRIYFRRNKAMRHLFTYQSLLSKVQGKSTVSGINITAEIGGTLLPLTTARATFMPTGYSFDATEEGIIPCKLPAGKYSVTITAPGMQSVETTLTIKSGTVSRKKFTFNKATQTGEEKSA